MLALIETLSKPTPQLPQAIHVHNARPTAKAIKRDPVTGLVIEVAELPIEG